MLEIRELTKIYSGNKPAIDSVTFDVKDGEIVGFVGLNGAGKTTTIKISCGALLPTKGTVFVDSYDIVKDKVEASKRVAWLPEIPIFDNNAKAIKLLKYFAGFHGISGDKAEKLARELLKRVGLEGFEEKKIGSYSQGMKKRFALAAALISDPQNFLFDEVLNGLDPTGIRFFRELALELKKDKKAVLFSSHILSEVENLADRIVIIHKGKIIKIMYADELKNYSEPVLKITISNLNPQIVNYLSSLGEVNIEGKNITLRKYKEDPALINSELVKMGASITSFFEQKEGLEEFFLKLIGEK
jgi:ABC-2 type transport system ATP-binding protein